MTLKQPPFVNGEMTLTNEQVLEIREKLVVIRESFEETDEHPVCDTFYLTSTYNRENPDQPINGDTCEMLLAEDGEADGETII
jgi:hypothetical protein